MPAARKTHYCNLCYHAIAPGTEYISRRVTPWDSDGDIFWTFRAHPECDAIWQKVGPQWDWVLPQCASDWLETLRESIPPQENPMALKPPLPDNGMVPCFGGPMDGNHIDCQKGQNTIVKVGKGFYRLDPQMLKGETRWVYRWSDR